MAEPTICPITRQECGSREICWLIYCAKSAGSLTRLRPIPERDLSQAERYALHMARQRSSAPPDPEPGR